MRSKARIESEFNTPEESPGFLLWQVSTQWQRHIRTALKGHGLTHIQFVLLASTVWMEDHGRKVNQNALSKLTTVDKMMVSDVVRALEKKRLIQRKAMPGDARAFLIGPTHLGVTLVQKAIKTVEEADEAFFSRSKLSIRSITDCLKSLVD